MSFNVELATCSMCRRGVTGGTSFCAEHVVAGVGRPFVGCAVPQCELPCRDRTTCVVHGSGVPRSAFEEDVVALQKKRRVESRFDVDDEGLDETGTPSWRVSCRTELGVPCLQALLEQDDVGRPVKLGVMAQLYAMQVARLEDVLRSADNQQTLNLALWPSRSPAPEPPASDRVVELSQREAGSVSSCRHKGCAEEALAAAHYCVNHICDDTKQTMFAACVTCKAPVLRALLSDTCPTHTPPAPKMKPLGKM
jgi:hypothetical protein